MAFIGNTSTTQAFTPAVDYFSGNASTTAFTLSRPVASVAQVQVVVNNVAQNPSSAYTVSSNTITFTSAPSSGTNNIYVYYTSPITQVIAPGQGTVNTTALGNITNIASGNSSLTLQTGSGNTTAVTIDTSQNVGIGTTSPTAKLDVSSSSAGVTAGDLVVDTANKTVYVGRQSSTGGDNSYLVVRGRVNGSGTNQAIAITGDTSAYGTGLFRPGNDILGFSTLATERMRINSGGQVNVNTTGNTDAFLVVNGATNHAIRTLRDGTANSTQISFANANGTVGSITTNGSATAYNTSSDYRLKENIAPMTGALAKVALLKPVTYKWKVDGTDGEGFIAHELAEVVPECVTGTKDELDAEGNPVYQGVDASFLIATLTAAIQELSAKNDALTARIEALENK